MLCIRSQHTFCKIHLLNERIYKKKDSRLGQIYGFTFSHNLIWHLLEYTDVVIIRRVVEVIGVVFLCYPVLGDSWVLLYNSLKDETFC